MNTYFGPWDKDVLKVMNMTVNQRIRYATITDTISTDTEDDVEIGIEGEFYKADTSVGINSGGFDQYGAFRIDNGKPIVLTRSQAERITEDACVAASEGYEPDDRPDYD